MRVTIAGKIGLSLGILVTGFLISTLVGFYRGHDTARRLRLTADELFPATHESQLAKVAFKDQTRLYNQAVLTGETGLLDEADAESGKVKRALDNILAYPDVPLRKQTRQLNDAVRKYSIAAGVLYRRMCTGTEADNPDQQAARAADLAQQAQDIAQSLEDLQAAYSRALQLELADAGRRMKRESNLILALFVVVVTAAVGLAALIVLRTITRPLRRTVTFVEQLAAGDLTRAIEVTRHDEIGDMLRVLNDMSANLRGMIQNIITQAGVLTRSSRDLMDTSKHLAGKAADMREQTAVALESGRQMAQRMETMDLESLKMHQSVRGVAAAAEEIATSIGAVTENTDQASRIASDAADLAESSNTKIQHLGKAANEIGKVLEDIQDITSRTNLLALNAAIEAASAGEAGRGFAVVANEVKELAKQTNSATLNISQRIEAMQNSTHETIQIIQQVRDIINKVNEVSKNSAAAFEQQRETIHRISASAGTAADSASTVSQSVSHTVRNSQEIAQHIVALETVARETASSADRMRTAGESLAGLAGELQKMMEQFRV